MSRSFKSYNIEQFENFVDNLSKTRHITHIQIHHTWKPRKIDYKGESTIRGMWSYHTKTRGWQDIAQHFSVAPDGLLWDGRSLEIDPAGIAGHNKGGIMFEIIGDFDEGQETLEGTQLYAVTKATSLLLKKFNLSYDDIVFHREHAAKSCPGTGLSKERFIELVKRSEPTQAKQDVSQWAVVPRKWVIAQGISDGSRPQDTVTREQVWTMLYRALNKPSL